MSETPLEERVRLLETSTAVVRHDVNNIRMSTTGLEIKIDKLNSSISRVGISIVATLIIMLISIVGYFIIQKDQRLQQLQSVPVIEKKLV